MREPRILFLGLNYPPEEIGIAIYSGELCKALPSYDFQVKAVVANPYYPAWRIFAGYRSIVPSRRQEDGVDVTRTPIYVPANPSGVKRILHHVSFALSAGPVLLFRAWRYRPDIVITVAPSLVAAPMAILAAKLVGAKTWLHVQDLEVGAAFATGLLEQTSRLGRIALKFESAIVGMFDAVSSISFEMCRKLRELGVPSERLREFRNWSDTDAILPMTRPSRYRERWNISTPHVALYSGNIANKQGIDIVVDVARRMAHRADLTFVICGEGPNRARLEARAEGLGNVQFHDLQPAAELNELMGLATIHLLPQKASAADLVLPSKLTNMLASGRPVVATAIADTGLARELDACGLITPPEDATALAGAIETLIEDPALHARLCTAARSRAEQVWQKKKILDGMAASLKAMIESNTVKGKTDA